MKNASGFCRIALVNIRSWIIKPTNGCCGDGSVFWKSSSGLSCYKGVAKSSSCFGHLRSHQFRIGSQASFLPVAPYVQRLNLHGSIKGSVIKERSLQCILFGCNYSHLHGRTFWALFFLHWHCSQFLDSTLIGGIAMLSIESVRFRSQFCYPSIGRRSEHGVECSDRFLTLEQRLPDLLTWVAKQHNGRRRLSPRYWMLGKSHLLRKE